MKRNVLILILSVIIYHFYVANIFFELPPQQGMVINLLIVPIFMGAISSWLFVSDIWIRVVLSAAIPVAPMAFAGSYVDTGGINIAYIGPLMAVFAAGAGITQLLLWLIAKKEFGTPK